MYFSDPKYSYDYNNESKTLNDVLQGTLIKFKKISKVNTIVNTKNFQSLQSSNDMSNVLNLTDYFF